MNTNANANAVRAGIRRGITEHWISLRTPSETAFMVIGLAIVGVVLWLNRDTEIAPGVAVASFIVPSILTIQLLFITCYGLATVVVTEREDGTLIRSRSLPNGLRAYSTGILTRTMCELIETIVLTIVIAAVILGGSLGVDGAGLAVIAGMLILGTIALTTFGFVIGTVFRNPRSVGGWGFLAVGALALVSGLIQPLSTMPAWVQVIGQGSPLYWIGHAFRSAFLPEGAGAFELGGGWQLAIAFAVVGAWAVAGILLAPVLLRRVARRETGSAIEARRQAALQRV
ncbi:ABC transporter permease [Agromyces sp. SYSU K20354]|uniref:ABC transporter permease n=1 Tax=Agromyces cavernae TaxID=2898659 RepID=UPI001E4C1BDA|nr:ABC transporter permease [Agromyces cavernae]MCD2441725.1 ABC transporter permease [Agromyces cavernae]